MPDQLNIFHPNDTPEDSLDIGSTPLARQMRPVSLDEYVGQAHLLKENAPFRRALESDTLGSFILWGPPGCGKTSLAYLVSRYTKRKFVSFSAVTSGVADLRIVVTEARRRLKTSKLRTILFVDEIHRFNRTQQDGFLPHVEDGTIMLIGATTENPSFKLVGPLISRCTVYQLHRLEPSDVTSVLHRALDTGVGDPLEWKEEAVFLIAEMADGDLRKGLNLLETISAAHTDHAGTLTEEEVRSVATHQALLYDRSGEEHYNLISALHKCIRDSQTDAALYWLARMLESGEDPLYLARRLVRIASEDVGTANPQALPLAVSAMQTVQLLGLPEADCALAEIVIYLSLSPKSNAVYRALGEAKRDARNLGARPVPLVLRNAPTKLMGELGYGEDYRYAHDDPEGAQKQQHWPDGVNPRRYFEPRGAGWEKKVLDWWENYRKKN